MVDRSFLKIKLFAKVNAFVGSLASPLFGIVFFILTRNVLPFAVAAMGYIAIFISGWVLTMLLTFVLSGFGDLIESTKNIEIYLSKILNNTQISDKEVEGIEEKTIPQKDKKPMPLHMAIKKLPRKIKVGFIIVIVLWCLSLALYIWASLYF